MAKQNKSNPAVRPFVERGGQLGYVGPLKERGLWPPRLHNRKDQNPGNDKPVTTPYLVVLNSPADVALRPLPQAQAFHSQGVWIEDMGGATVSVPVVGGKYRIKCLIKNFGAFPAYAGLVDFYVDQPSVFTAAVGTSLVLPTFGHGDLKTLLQGETKMVVCSKIWRPVTNADLLSGILVHAYDFITDGVTSRYDAVNDGHVGRLDFTSDFYVRDWTDSAAVHDLGQEPSSHPVFYRTSDIWNRRVSDPGVFVNDRPAHQNPQAGEGAAGDNVVFARISRNNADTQETVRAHFMVAEFGTGSPYTNCSPTPDPVVTFLPGQKTQLVSLPWHLHPTASPHLCMAVQIYSDADPFMAPGLVGNTPGWPTTDQMVTNDNNKAQRNMHIWDHIPETEGTAWAMVFNASLFTRDVSLQIMTSDEDTQRVRNPTILLAGAADRQPFQPGAIMTLSGMLPGERRYVGFSYDALLIKEGQGITVLFNEMVGKAVVNGYSLELQGATPANVMKSVLERQQAVFFRLQAGFGIAKATKGMDLVKQLMEGRPSTRAYIQHLPAILSILTDSLNELSSKQGGVKDVFSVNETTRKLGFLVAGQSVNNALALHLKLLNSVDAWQTTVLKNQGDEADIPFTLRLQQRVFSIDKVRSDGIFDELFRQTDLFIVNYNAGKVTSKDYQLFIQTQLGTFNRAVERVGARTVKITFDELVSSVSKSPALVQKAHLNFLNTVVARF